jgi:hypothetical protein
MSVPCANRRLRSTSRTGRELAARPLGRHYHLLTEMLQRESRKAAGTCETFAGGFTGANRCPKWPWAKWPLSSLRAVSGVNCFVPMLPVCSRSKIAPARLVAQLPMVASAAGATDNSVNQSCEAARICCAQSIAARLQQLFRGAPRSPSPVARTRGLLARPGHIHLVPFPNGENGKPVSSM